jgi:peptidoglycan/xylan/chitin deacetylase (PgdA/CDA1 family)
MIEMVFTVDYELYGNGSGTLREQVYQPTERLVAVFQELGLPLVVFVEASELQKIEETGCDEAMHEVRQQIRRLHQLDHEVALHVHPQWCNARYENCSWVLDYSEYNLCTLAPERIAAIIAQSVSYLRDVTGDPAFTPLAFRAGNWLLQPTEAVAGVLAGSGIKIDSSVFKGGLQRMHKLDYRPARNNGYFWRFRDDVNLPHAEGELIEVPTHTAMVPFWKMLTAKRVALQAHGGRSPVDPGRLSRLRDYLRLWYPLKFDFCRMTLDELLSMLDTVIREDRSSPESYKPIVAIGHTKDLDDLRTLDLFLRYVVQNEVKVVTFRDVYPKVAIGPAPADRG